LYIILNYTIEMKIYVWKKLTLMQISWHGLHNFIRVIILIKRYWSWYLIGFSHNCFKTLKNVFLDLYIFKVSFLSCNIITSHINEKPFFFFRRNEIFSILVALICISFSLQSNFMNSMELELDSMKFEFHSIYLNLIHSIS